MSSFSVRFSIQCKLGLSVSHSDHFELLMFFSGQLKLNDNDPLIIGIFFSVYKLKAVYFLIIFVCN